MELGQIVGWKTGETTKRKSDSHNKLPSPCLTSLPNIGLSQGLITFPPSSVCSVAANQWPTDSLCPSLVSARNRVIKPWPWAPFIHFLSTVTPRNGRGEGLLWRLLHQSLVLMKMWSTGRTHCEKKDLRGQPKRYWVVQSFLHDCGELCWPTFTRQGFVHLQFLIMMPTDCPASFPCPSIPTENPPFLCMSSGQCQVRCPAQI